jgi:hypothetical protein
VVGAGAGAELGDGAGAGAELGGARVGDGAEPPPPPPPDPPDEPPDPPDEPEEPDPADEPEPPDEPGELDELDEPVEPWPGCALGWAPGVFTPRPLWRRLFEWEWVREAQGFGHDVTCFTMGVGVAWPTVWAGAVPANKAVKPTAVTALSSVARQVMPDRRCSPTARVSPGSSPVMVDSIMVGES